MQGLTEAIEYEKGFGEAHKTHPTGPDSINVFQTFDFLSRVFFYMVFLF